MSVHVLELPGHFGRRQELLAEAMRLYRDRLLSEGDVALALKGLVGDDWSAEECAELARLATRSEAEARDYSDPFKDTESGHAEHFAATFGDRVRFDHGAKEWRVFENHHWRRDVDGEIDRLILQAGRARQLAAVGDKERLKKMVRTEDATVRERVKRLARSERPIATDGEHWNPDPWLLGVKNGVVDLQTGERRDGKPEDMVTLWVPVRYTPGTRCPKWENFVESIFRGRPEMPAYLQRVLGYVLTAEVTEQCFWILFGEGANGKSTLLEVLMKILGPYGWPIPFPGAGWSNSLTEYQKAALHGRRLVISAEGGRVTLNDSFVKDLSGGDTINGRHPCGRPFDFRPECKLFLRVNKKPGIRDRTHGLWRKIKLVEFRETFTVDPHFVERFDAELPGILTWLVEGALAWQEEGLSHPAEVEAATAAYRHETDDLGEFLAERCTEDPKIRERARVLFSGYNAWADEQKTPPSERLNLKAFVEEMAKRYEKVDVTKPREARGVWYVGVGLSQGGPDDVPF